MKDMRRTPDVSNEMSSIVGSDFVVKDPEGLEKYRRDMADYAGAPLLAVRPKDVPQTAAIMRAASRLAVPVVPWGAGSSLTGAAVSNGGVVVDMSRMDRILKIDPVNWYVHAQAGVVLEALNKELSRSGFFFPPDPASSFLCTVGGAVAEGSGGMRCVRYGTVKDWVLALKVVLPSGEVAVMGEPLPKNRAGYDLVHLFVGSEGTLGIIVEAWLKIAPLPKDTVRRMMAHFDSWEDATTAISAMRRERIQPLLLEFMDRPTVESVNRSLGTSYPNSEATLLVDVDRAQFAGSKKILVSAGCVSLRLARGKKEADEMYHARAWAYVALKAESPAIQTEDVCVPIDSLADMMRKVKEVAARYDLLISVNGHAGDGNIHPLISYDPTDDESTRRANSAFLDICEYAIAVGGSVTGEHGIGLQKPNLLRKQLASHGGSEALALMKAIKSVVDSKGIMNPGKFVEAA